MHNQHALRLAGPGLHLSLTFVAAALLQPSQLATPTYIFRFVPQPPNFPAQKWLHTIWAPRLPLSDSTYTWWLWG